MRSITFSSSNQMRGGFLDYRQVGRWGRGQGDRGGRGGGFPLLLNKFCKKKKKSISTYAFQYIDSIGTGSNKKMEKKNKLSYVPLKNTLHCFFVHRKRK